METSMSVSIFIQIFGMLSSLALILEGFSKTRKRIIWFGIACSGFSMTQYIISGNLALIPICAITILRICSAAAADKHPIFDGKAILFLFMAAYTIFYLLGIFGFTEDQKGVSSLWFIIPLVASLIACYGYRFHSPLLLKIFLASAQVGWLCFDLVSGYYTSLLGDVFTILANGIALTVIIYEHNHPKERRAEDNPVAVITQAIPIITRAVPVITSQMERIETTSIPIVKQKRKLEK